MNARHAGLLVIAATLLFGGCSDRKLRPLNPCTVTGVVRKVSGGGSENVDLLFMIDNSGSMETEQAALAEQLPRIATVLLTGDLDGDPLTPSDFPPVASLRVGVINSDMGVLGIGTIDAAARDVQTMAIQKCGTDAEGQFFGEDARIQLVTPAGSTQPNCEPTYPTFLQFDQASPGAGQQAFIEDVACTAVLGIDGCGFEMQLEAVLAAVTDSSEHPEIAFAPTTAQGAPRNRTGQAGPGGANAGFFRDGSVIGVVLVTDEEDCSTDNPEMFMFSSLDSTLQDPNHDGDPVVTDLRVNTRCTHFASELYDIQRYVDGLRNLRPDEPEKVVFAGIVGLPTDLETATFDEMLADSRMQYTDRLDGMGRLLDPGQDPFIVPACWRCESDPSASSYDTCPDPVANTQTNFSNEGLQWAAPGRRYVQLADAMADAGMNAVIRSICTDDFGPAVESILERIGSVLKGACLPRALNPDATGAVNCDVVEILPVGVTCAERADMGRDPTPIRTEAGTGGDREVCRIQQLVPTDAERSAQAPPAGTGWYYDNYSSSLAEQNCPAEPGAPLGQRIGFTDTAIPVLGDVRLECLQPVTGGGLSGADVYQACSAPTECALTTVEQMDEFIFRYNLARERFISGGALTGTQPMTCDGATNTCQITCGDASDCPGGFACVNPTTNTSQDCGSTQCFCANPTCTVTGGAGGGGTGGGSGGGAGGGTGGDAG